MVLEVALAALILVTSIATGEAASATSAPLTADSALKAIIVTTDT